MFMVRKKLTIEEVLDVALDLLQCNNIRVPSFIQWVDEVIKENKTLPRLRNGHEKDRNTKSVQAVQADTTPNATSD